MSHNTAVVNSLFFQKETKFHYPERPEKQFDSKIMDRKRNNNRDRKLIIT